MRIHVGVGLLVLALGRWLGFDAVRQAVLVLTVGLVIGAEWLNTAIEHTVDLVTRQYHPLARLAKDLAAGAVLWCGAIAVIVGFLLFLPHWQDLPALVLTAEPARLAEMLMVAAASAALVFSGLRR